MQANCAERDRGWLRSVPRTTSAARLHVVLLVDPSELAKAQALERNMSQQSTVAIPPSSVGCGHEPLGVGSCGMGPLWPPRGALGGAWRPLRSTTRATASVPRVRGRSLDPTGVRQRWGLSSGMGFGARNLCMLPSQWARGWRYQSRAGTMRNSLGAGGVGGGGGEGGRLVCSQVSRCGGTV